MKVKSLMFWFKDNHRLATAYSCLDACKFIESNMENLISMILFHGDHDVITDYKSLENFYNINSSDKEFVSIKNDYHNLMVKSIIMTQILKLI